LVIESFIINRMTKSLRAEQEASWKGGERVSIETYVGRYPELARDPESLADLILGEILLREAAGESSQIGEYLKRFPQCGPVLMKKYRADLVTAVAHDMPPTVNASPSPTSETIQLDEDAQLAAQEASWAASIPKIPGYTIVCELGRGGMGVVYRARQLSADRDVALKVVRNDVLDTLPMATRDSTLQRFKHEAHAAARLEHDNLVPVYDVGDSGSLRYYAMRFVDGTSLYDMLRERPLDNRRAAAYLEPVARGLHFAHQKGVLHRDLKPHNIIVERRTDRPMLTDFGLAKFLEQRNELTHAGAVMGTPSYMSPEQARDSGKVTALADVYSMGATLYHVLTSRPPFQASNIAETIRQVLDEEPIPPRRLNPAIDRDLETICLKCLQKDPARRYESAETLADDLKCYLEHKPILARPISRTERMWRWCRRNPRLALMILATVLLGTFWITALVHNQYKMAAQMARRNFVINDLFTEASQNDLLNEPGMQPVRQKLLEKALAHYQELLKESGGRLVYQDEVAAAHFRVGVIQQEMGEYDTAKTELTAALDQQQKLLQWRPNDPRRLEALGDTLNALGKLFTQTDQLAEAAKAYEQANDFRSKLVDQAPDSGEWQRKLANVQANLGLVELNQGMNETTAGRTSAALEEAGRNHLQDAQERRLSILSKDPEFAAARRDLAMGYFMLAKFDALRYYNSGNTSQSDADSAIAKLREAVKHFNLVGTKEMTNRYVLAVANRQLGGLLAATGDTAGAIAAYEAAKAPITTLAVGNPEVAVYQSELAALAMNLGDLYQTQNDLPRALNEWSQARTLLEGLLESEPENPDYRRDMAATCTAIGRIELLQGNAAAAAKTLDDAITRLQSLLSDSPDDPTLTKWLEDAQADLKQAQSTASGGRESPGDNPPSSEPAGSADKNRRSDSID